MGRCLAYVVPFAFITLLWTSCSEEQLFPGNARIKTTFRLTSPHALSGNITIQQAYLKLEGISVTGRLGDENAPDATHPIPAEDPPYRLTQGDTAQVSLTLPTPVYDKMDLHLFLPQTDYQLIVHQKTNETPPPINDGNAEPDGGTPNPNTGNDNGGSTDGGDPNNGDPDDTEDDREEEKEEDDREDNDDGRDDDADQTDDEQDGHDDGNGEHEDDEDDDHDKKDKDDKKKGKDDDRKDKDDDKGKGDDDDRDDKDDDDKDDDDGADDRVASNEVTGTVDLDHFFQHAKPSVVVFATLTLNAQNINIVFAITDLKEITIPATQNDGPRIVVDEHGRASADFNPERWFESISTTDLENASLQSYQGQTVMFIHKDVNTPLFEKLLHNFINSTTFEVAIPAAP